MENKFREYWVYSNEEYAPTYACDFNQRGFVPSRNRESIHTIEIAAVEQLKAENNALKSKLKNIVQIITKNRNPEELTEQEKLVLSEIGGEI